MRILAFLSLVFGSWWFLTGDHSAIWTSPIAAIGNTLGDLWSIVPRPGERADAALRAEQDNSALLKGRITELGGELAHLKAEVTSRSAGLEIARKTLLDREEAIRSEHARAEALALELAAVKREQSSASRSNVSDALATDETSRAERALAEENLKQARLQIAAGNEARRLLQDELRATSRTFEGERDRSSALEAQLVQVQQEAGDRIRGLQEQLSTTQRRSAQNEDSVRGPTSNSDQQSIAAGAPTAVPATVSRVQDGMVAARYRLPDAVATRIIVRYSPASASARDHAISVCTNLQAQGVVIEQLVEASSRVQANGLGFYYNNDASRAARIAALFPELRSNMHQRSAADSIPRPGLIEIDIAS
jgi:hypothetical protein